MAGKRLEISRDAVPEWCNQYTLYSEDDGRRVATVFEPKEYAEYIVRACNAHEALTEACKDAAWLYDQMALGPLEAAAKYGPDYEPPTDQECLNVRQALHEALALAEVNP